MIKVELSDLWVSNQLFLYGQVFQGPVDMERFNKWLIQRHDFEYLHVDSTYSYFVGVDNDEEAVMLKLKTSA